MHTYTHNRRKITTFYGNVQIFLMKNEIFLRNLPELTEINLLIAERGEKLIVKEFALRVTEPAPFIEVAAHIDDMYPEVAEGVIGRLRVMVHNRDRRQEECQVVAMDSAGEIHIFRVHKIALVEESGFEGCRSTQEHKTATEVRRIKRTIISGKTEFVSLGAFSRPALR